MFELDALKGDNEMDEQDDLDKYRQQLAQDVELAFANIPYPSDDEIVEDPTSWVTYELPSIFANKHWREIPLSLIVQERLSLVLFTHEAFRFFLPAYLRAALLYPDEVDTLPDNIFYALTPPNNDESEMEKFREKVSGFTESQIEVIKAFVKMYITIETSYPDPKRDRASNFWLQK